MIQVYIFFSLYLSLTLSHYSPVHQSIQMAKHDKSRDGRLHTKWQSSSTPVLTRYCINVAVCTHFNMIHIGLLNSANMEIILKWVQTAILMQYLIYYVFCITRLNTSYFCIFAVHYYCFSLVNILQNVQTPMSMLVKPHQCHTRQTCIMQRKSVMVDLFITVRIKFTVNGLGSG